MKKLLLLAVFGINCNGMTPKDSDEAWAKWGAEWQKSGQIDSVCKSIITDKSTGWINPSDIIARLNRDCLEHRVDCPFGCRKFFIQMVQDLTVKFIQDLYAENLVTYEIMEYEICSLRTDRNAQVVDPILERIKKLKEETNS